MSSPPRRTAPEARTSLPSSATPSPSPAGILDRDSTYVVRWLADFQRYRRTTLDRLTGLSRRLEVEIEFVQPAPHEMVGRPRGYFSRAAGSVAGKVARWVRFMRRIPQIRASLSRLRNEVGIRRGTSDVLLAIASNRLYSAAYVTGPRAYLASLLACLGREEDGKSLERAAAEAARLIVLDPMFESQFCPFVEQAVRDDVIVIDSAHLVYAVLRSPIAFMRRVIAAARTPESRAVFLRSWRDASDLLAALLFDCAYALIFRPGRSRTACFLTTNSFATEVLRAHLLADASAAQLVEVQHGIPPVWEETYMASVGDRATEVGRLNRLTVVPQISGLPAAGAFARRHFEDGAGVNAYLNRHLFGERNAAGEFLKGVRRQWAEAFPDLPTVTDRLIVSYTGTTAWIGDAMNLSEMSSGNMEVERHVMRRLATELRRRGIPFVMVYSPHPSLDMRVVRSHPFFPEAGVVVHDSTVFTWFIADAGASLYSSTLFEAAYFGARVFTPVAPNDGIYTEELMQLVSHPEGSGDLDASISRFVDGIEPRGPIDMMMRAAERLHRLGPSFVRDGASPASL